VYRTGFLVVYAGWMYGMLSLVWAVRVARRPGVTDPLPDAVVAAATAVMVAALGLPSHEGWAPDGRFLVESGWVGLDPFSTSAMAAMAAMAVWLVARTRGGDDRHLVLASLAASAGGLGLGNLMIQSTTTRGSEPRVGAYLYGAAGALALVGAALQLRSAGRARRP
jgi:hypothetical protein